MRVRLLVIALFVAASLVPVQLAYHAGLLHETDASAELTPVMMDKTWRASLGWSSRPLGLAASSGLVVWEQRGRRGAGLWGYDVKRRLERRLLSRAALGQTLGAPRVSGPHVVWAARRHAKDPQIYEFDLDIGFVTTAASHGSRPAAGGDTAAWIWRGQTADVIRVTDRLTGEEASIKSASRVDLLAVWDGWVAWGAGKPGHLKLWTTQLARPDLRYLLATDASALGMDATRIVWATERSDGQTAVVSWHRKQRRSQTVCVTPGPITSLALGKGLVAWTRQTDTGTDIWACDVDSGAPAPVTEAPGDQVSPVFVGRTLFWADDKSGSWELHAEPL